MERWWCLDCRTPVDLNRHGRCESCDSEAVDTMERIGMLKRDSVVHSPVADVAAERMTVHLQTTLRWSGDSSTPSVDAPILTY